MELKFNRINFIIGRYGLSVQIGEERESINAEQVAHLQALLNSRDDIEQQKVWDEKERKREEQ